MWELNDVISIEYRDGFTFHIRFDDGLEGDVDSFGVHTQRLAALRARQGAVGTQQ
jgi:hypothetical protein